MKYQVMFVYSPMFYDEVDSEYDNAFEAQWRLRWLQSAGFGKSYINKINGTIKKGHTIQQHGTPLITITVNGTPLETTIKFKSKAEAVAYLLNSVTMFRGVKYEVRVTQRYEVTVDKVLPIPMNHPDKTKFLNEVMVIEPANPEDNYCGGY